MSALVFTVGGRSSRDRETPMDTRLWLAVPFAEKDEAKQLGARWDPAQRRWYAPRPGMTALARWAPRPDLPDLLPGEDRCFGSGLFVDLVPQSCWFTNVRTCVAAGDWDRVRQMVYRRTGDRCEACGRHRDPDAGIQMEAHERWGFDDARGVQILRRLICLCGDCHGATHFGLASIQGRSAQALEHLALVTGTSRELAEAHADEAFGLWEQRSARTWDLDLSILTDAGVQIVRPAGSAAERAEVSARRAAAGRQPRVERRSPGDTSIVSAWETPVCTDDPDEDEAPACRDEYGGGGVTITAHNDLPPWLGR
jgi:Domain of unknown function (DUF5710)